MIFGFNKNIACRPPIVAGNVSKVVNGVAQSVHRSSLTALEVVYGTPEVPAGSYVYVASSRLQEPWGSTKHTVEGEQIILVPEGYVLLVKKIDHPYTYNFHSSDTRIVPCSTDPLAK